MTRLQCAVNVIPFAVFESLFDVSAYRRLSLRWSLLFHSLVPKIWSVLVCIKKKKKQRQHIAEGHIYLLLVFLRDMAATWTD